MTIMQYILINIICAFTLINANPNIKRAQQTLDSLYRNYASPNTCLLREHYPFDQNYKASYLASEEQAGKGNKYSYLWPYSGTFSAVNTLLATTGDNKYQLLLENKVLPGLEEYFDTQRVPSAYSSYLNNQPLSDRFYDDNIWLGIDFTDYYLMTEKQEYLKKAELIWNFIISGKDEALGGGIYWCEQKKETKNTCSNAPAAVFAFKLFQATQDSTYLKEGKELYEWTKENLEDSKDHLYFDKVSLNKKIDRTKYAYNSGQMMQAAALLFQITKQKEYLKDAQEIARACHKHFFTRLTTPDGIVLQLPKKGNIWFTAIMLRGFVELYQIDHNKTYLTDFQLSLHYAWHHARDEQGLFQKDWSGMDKDDKKWLLTQAAFVEMYGRLACVDIK